MWQFIKRNWIPIVVGIVGLTVGFLLNIYANKQSEKRIIEALIAQINELKAKQQMGRINAKEQNKLLMLQAQLQLLTKRNIVGLGGATSL